MVVDELDVFGDRWDTQWRTLLTSGVTDTVIEHMKEAFDKPEELDGYDELP